MKNKLWDKAQTLVRGVKRWVGTWNFVVVKIPRWLEFPCFQTYSLAHYSLLNWILSKEKKKSFSHSFLFFKYEKCIKHVSNSNLMLQIWLIYLTYMGLVYFGMPKVYYLVSHRWIVLIFRILFSRIIFLCIFIFL